MENIGKQLHKKFYKFYEQLDTCIKLSIIILGIQTQANNTM